MNCPVCNTAFSVYKMPDLENKEVYEARIDIWDKMNVLGAAIRNYHRWVAEGYPKFGGIHDGILVTLGDENEGKQVYYDDENCKISYDNNSNTYYFDLLNVLSQTSGLVRWKGKCKMDRGGKIYILTDNSEIKEDKKLEI